MYYLVGVVIDLRTPALKRRNSKNVNEMDCLLGSVVDLDPDPHILGPPGSGSVSHKYRSGSGSFHYQAKIVRKTLISTVL